MESVSLYALNSVSVHWRDNSEGNPRLRNRTYRESYILHQQEVIILLGEVLIDWKVLFSSGVGYKEVEALFHYKDLNF